MTVYLIVLLAMLNQIGLKGSKVLVSLFAIELGASPLTIGALISMYAVFPLLLAVYAGRITDRIGVRWPMVLGSFGMTIGLALPALSGSTPMLFAAAALLGFANIFFHVSCHNLIGSLGEGHERTKNFSTFSLGAAISGMLGPVVAGFSVDHAGYAPAFAGLAVIVVLPGFALLLSARLIPAKVRVKAEKHPGGLRELLANRPLRNTVVTSGLIITGIDLFNFYMPIYGRSVGLQASTIGIVIGMQAAAAFVVRLWMPWLAKRFTEKWVLVWSLLLAGMTYFLFPFFQNPLVLAAISFVLGLGLGCGQPLSIVQTYNHSPPNRSGEALGLRLTVNKLTQISVPLAFGSLGAIFGAYPIFWANAVLLLMGGYITSRNTADGAKTDEPRSRH